MSRLRIHLRLALTLLVGLGCRVAATPPPDAVVVQAPAPAPAAEVLPLPTKPDSLKFAVIGDMGNGNREQAEIGQRMAELRATFPFGFVITCGDNIYGGQSARDLVNKFERPYQVLLDAGVKFYASLGNHDDRTQRFYKHFNMNGQTYYTFKPEGKQSVRFFALESDTLDRAQLDWLERQLREAGEDWKIAYFHHPPYSSGGRHGSDVNTRKVLEPLFLKYNVSLVFAGHDHFYERIKPQNGIQYFVEGSSGQLRRGDIEKGSPLTAKGFDTDQTFMVVEIDGDDMFFQAIARPGKVVDSGTFKRRDAKTSAE